MTIKDRVRINMMSEIGRLGRVGADATAARTTRPRLLRYREPERDEEKWNPVFQRNRIDADCVNSSAIALMQIA
jgi:hypothetical protein